MASSTTKTGMISRFWKISITLDISRVAFGLPKRLASAQRQEADSGYAAEDRTQQQQAVYAVPIGEVSAD